MKPRLIAALIGVSAIAATDVNAQPAPTYRVLATAKTSTMEKEMKQAGAEGFQFTAVMGGETAAAGNQVVVLMGRDGRGSSATYDYKLLATSKTSTMQKELQQAADAGFEYMGQTVFESLFGGQEVVVILQKDPAASDRTRWEYRLLATSQTSTLERELRDTSELGFEVLAMTVGKTAMGGSEMVAITRRRAR